MTILRRSGAATSENVRMSPLALFTLMAVICLAVLSVLAISTANATMAMAQRRADATTQLYMDEEVAQAFVAALDARRSAALTNKTIRRATKAALKNVSADAAEQVAITTSIEGRNTINASFSCGNGRQLDITLRRDNDGAISIQRWRMMAVVNDEPTIGDLFGGF